MSRAQFASSYVTCPIVLVGGIAANAPEGKMLITQLLQTASGSDSAEPFAQFRPVAGGDLIKNDVGHYPFANQAVAANAMITEPLRISLTMTCPATVENGGWANKSTVMANLQASLAQHCAQGGWFIVATPAVQYATALLLSLRDVSGGASNQAQYEFQWDFEQPLLTQQQAAQSLNTLLSKIDSGTRVNVGADGAIAWSGLDNSQGAPALGSSATTNQNSQYRSAALTSLNAPPSYSLAPP